MTIRIVDNFPHHPYTRMAKAFMPSLECINILKNYLVCNMRYGFEVCVVQSERKRGNFLNNSFAISAIFSNKKNFLIEKGFTIGKVDTTLFTKKLDGHIFICQVYVDIIFGSSNEDS